MKESSNGGNGSRTSSLVGFSISGVYSREHAPTPTRMTILLDPKTPAPHSRTLWAVIAVVALGSVGVLTLALTSGTISRLTKTQVLPPEQQNHGAEYPQGGEETLACFSGDQCSTTTVARCKEQNGVFVIGEDECAGVFNRIGGEQCGRRSNVRSLTRSGEGSSCALAQAAAQETCLADLRENTEKQAQCPESCTGVTVSTIISLGNCSPRGVGRYTADVRCEGAGVCGTSDHQRP